MKKWKSSWKSMQNRNSRRCRKSKINTKCKLRLQLLRKIRRKLPSWRKSKLLKRKRLRKSFLRRVMQENRQSKKGTMNWPSRWLLMLRSSSKLCFPKKKTSNFLLNLRCRRHRVCRFKMISLLRLKSRKVVSLAKIQLNYRKQTCYEQIAIKSLI